MKKNKIMLRVLASTGMLRALCLASLFFFSLIVMSCQQDDDVEFVSHPNPAYPQQAGMLRILAIGNSFTTDALYYFPCLIDSAHIGRDRICVYSATGRSMRLDQWLDVIKSGEEVELTANVKGVEMESKGTMRQLLSQPWDVVVIQQASDVSYRLSSYKCVSEYVEMIKSLCPNKRLCVFFQQVWSHTSKEDPYVFRANVSISKRMEEVLGPGCVIPTGVAVQNARQTNLNDDMYMTRDKWHLNEGIGRYIAALTWYEKMVAPVFGTAMEDNMACPKGDYDAAELSMAKLCVRHAIDSPFALYIPEE